MDKYYEEWYGEKYPIRVVPVDATELGFHAVRVADYELWVAIEYACDHEDAENHSRAVALDNEIFFYCDSGFIESDPTDEEIREYLTEQEVF